VYEKYRIAKQAIDDFNNCSNRVCVDYNFLNWYRASTISEPPGRVIVIPNFADINYDPNNDDKKRNKRQQIRILFARRFVEYRGTRLMARVTKILLSRYSNLSFSFAGSGPDEEYLKNSFRNIPEVNFIYYLPHDVQNILANHDIAVIPSLGSEGTSISVAEAMGAGLPVVATSVGGITNMIIDGYNGLLAMPNEQEVLLKLENLINDEDMRNDLGKNAFDTAKSAFSLNKWSDSWKKVLSQLVIS